VKNKRKGPMGTDQAFKPTPAIMGSKMKKKEKKGKKK
jgi:hypothetical protein